MRSLGKLVVIGAVVCTGLPVNAQVCTPLRVVEGTGTQVQKKVSVPGTPTSRSNWNTDFAVPSGRSFSRYVATIRPANTGQYDVQMFLKYPNNTADKVFDQRASYRERNSYTIPGSPRLNANPYQINVFVGGVGAVGNTYTLSVAGCN
ncbi:hypothetical protein H6F43_14190 [Leptolyngbya sp. FACHB-36]|uniref:hypothetical protein n=1 Tax=Leptolyngbya sp. FACHB-36 TaxID=2692808 RepID=UPI001681127C|nr:hypothetical protein [Leptolyngbya sp. FACHB-36]MBD2021327.1 hypothetical protein [Leptolyngbya sp. FACHB-36]